MKKLCFTILAVCALMTAPLFAMPTVAAVEKARPIISELMAEDLAALRSGKKTPVAVGDAAMALVANAETEAAKYVLAKAAFGLYLRGKDYDKATDALEQLRASIPDLPAADLVELVQKGAKGVRGREAPRLFAFYRQVQSQATAEKEVTRAKSLLAESPTPEHRRAYAEWCVLAGDWKTALAALT